jgi:hypothetical protein
MLAGTAALPTAEAASRQPDERHFFHPDAVGLSRNSPAAGGNVPAKLIFVVVAAVVAIGSAFLAGIITALAGLSAKAPTATLITLTTGSAAAAFGGVIALSGMAASILFNAPERACQKPSVISTAKRRRASSSIHATGRDQVREDAVGDEDLRAALEARALISKRQPATDAEMPTLAAGRFRGHISSPASSPPRS